VVPERGFTLIEVLVALAIFAVALTAALRTCSIATDAALDFRERLLAGWVAENRLAAYRVGLAPELGEHAVQIVRRQMDQRVPGKNSGEGVVGNREPVHRTEHVAPARAGRARVCDELGYQVDAGRVDVEGAQVFGEVPGAAAQVEHRAGPDRQVPRDEVEVVRVDLGGGAK